MRFEQLEGCAWEPMGDVGAKSCEHVGEKTITQCEDEDDWSSVGVESCRSEQTGLRSVRAVRLGPFFSLPGQWRSLSTYTLRGLLGDGDRVIGFVGAPTAEDGITPIGYPPLHVHHLHVRKAEEVRQGLGLPPVGRAHGSHWFETHGDYSRGDDFGVGAASAAGYATRLPAGHCYVVNSADALDINAEINDVRVLAAGASALAFYLTVAFELAEDAGCRPLSKFWLRRPASRELPADVWARYAAPPTPAVTWWSGVMPTSGRLLDAWRHTHRARDGGLLLLAAGPEVFRGCGALGVTAGAGDMAAVHNLTYLRHELSRRARVVCEDDISQLSSLLVRGHASEGIADGRYDRRGGLRCAEWSFAKGAPWTVVAFAQPRYDARAGAAAAAVAAAAPAAAAAYSEQHSEPSPLLPQHTELWMFVDLAPPGRAVPWSYATSSPQYADSPFYVAEANVCVERGTAPIALLFWSLHPVALVLVALLLAVTHVACQRLRSRGGYKRVPCHYYSSA